ncbi:MAG: PQQ-dependent sugar dehydrogenase [Chthoniobacteraceae bacterium]
MKRLLLLLVAVSGALAGVPLETDFADTRFVGGLNQPTCLAWAPDGSGRLFVSLKTSGIAVIENGVQRAELFATFPQLYTQSECGVLGLAFDPDFATNHFVYVFVTVSASEQRIVRFTDQDSTGTQRTNILTNLPTLGQNHDGGALGFGPDGKLYFAIGDLGAKIGVDGNLTSLAAKVGRANKDGTVPADNPFNDGAGPNNDYIWATGFRNPFTLTFRPGSGELWLNVVGSTPQGQTEPRTTAGYEQVFIVRRGNDGGYDDYEGNQPANPRYNTPFPRASIRPVIQYATDYFGDGAFDRTVASFQRGAGTLTVTTTSAHPFRVGQAVVLTNTGTLDGSYTVSAVPTTTSFTAAAPGSALGGSSGHVDALVQGGSITGGCFYDSSAFPAAYHGNFFYCDYVLGGLLRAQVGADGRPVKITRFIGDIGGPTDVAAGPDGALYYSDIGRGEVRRVAFTGVPGFIVSPTEITMSEGARAGFTVRPGAQPAGTVTVQIHKTGAIVAGANDVDILGSTSFDFTPQNWAVPQAVTLAAASDEDTLDDTATFTVTAPGFEPVDVHATAIDENFPQFVVSTNALELREGRYASFTYTLPAPPARPVLVRVRPGSGPRGRAQVVRGALLRLTAKNWNLPHRVILRGVQDTNRTDEAITYVVRATGYLDREIAVSVLDNDPTRPLFTSTPKQQAVVNRLYSYTPELRARPAPVFEIVSAPAGMSIDATTGTLTWTPDATGDFPVTLRASNRPGATDQTFAITVSADAAPVAFLIEPQHGATISGANAELFGGSVDDYGTAKAEFYIDGQLVHTDTNREAHYHLGGAHNLFDTTALTNGPHTLRIVVTDDAGQTGEASATVTVAN